MFLGDIIKNYRSKNKISQRDFAKKCNLSYTYISALEKNKDYRSGKPISPTLETVKAVANGINIPVEDLLKILDEEQSFTINNRPQFYMCPVYGRISAGQPNWAEECIEGRIPIDYELMNILNPEEYYFLKVDGESMNNVVKNGAFALIHKQDFVENGEIAVVLVNGDNATLKHFAKQGDVVVLTPDSSDNSFKQQIYDKTTPISVIGKYVGKMEINE